MRVLINPRQLPFDETAQEIARLLPSGLAIDVTERIEKGLVLEGVIIVISFFVGAVAKGFFSKAGADLYEYFKKLRVGKPPVEPTIHIAPTFDLRQRPVVVLLVADRDVPAWQLAQVDFDLIASQLETIAQGYEIQRAVAHIRPGPRVEFQFLVRADGGVVKRNG